MTETKQQMVSRLKESLNLITHDHYKHADLCKHIQQLESLSDDGFDRYIGYMNDAYKDGLKWGND